MPRYQRKGEEREVKLDGSTLLVVTSKAGGWLRRKISSETEKQTFDSALEARLAFAQMARQLRADGFAPVGEKKRKAAGTDVIARSTRVKFESTLEAEVPTPMSCHAARVALIGLYELRSAREAAERGDFFPDRPGLLDGLDPEPKIRAWEEAVAQAYGALLTPIQLESREQYENHFKGAGLPDKLEDYEASRRLGRLFELRSARNRSASGEFFPEAPRLLDGLDPEPLIERWRARIAAEHGEIGEQFFAEVSSRCGFPIEGIELRAGRRRETFRAAPVRSGRGFDRSGEDDEIILSLEEKLLADRDSLETYAVYADRLQELGNPLGDLVALGLAAEESGEDSAVVRFVKERGTELLGALAEISQDGVELSFRRGFIDEARFASDENDELHDGIVSLFECPAGSFLRGLTLGMMGDYELDYASTIELIAEEGPHPALEELFLGDFEYPDQIEMSWVIVGDVGPLWKALPNVRELTLQGGETELGKVSAPELRRLSLRSGGLPSEALGSIAEASWPMLEELELWLGTEEYGGDATIADVTAVLSAKMPKLAVLRLMNSELSDEIARALCDAEILPRLKTIDLSMGTLGSEGAGAIAGAIDRFAHLEKLDLSDNFLDADAIAAFANHPFVVCGEQKEADDDDGELYHYVSVAE